tara:strand:+ start:6368 stop:7060 length:693 start_codon:yes stop_codon:yes gene_type:complete
MKNLKLDRRMAQLVLLQRIELASPFLTKLRKTFGRYLFSKIISKYFINLKEISKNYSKLMESELSSILSLLKQNQRILSIGSGLGGLEIAIMKKFNETKITFIEKDYISNKIKYGWDDENREGYNDLSLLKNLIIMNDIPKEQFSIFDYDKKNFPSNKYNLVISLYSLDYHYDFNIYLEYLKKNTDENSIIVFDTIRYEYFNKIFNYVEIIKEDQNTIHKSKRIACKMFK